MTPTGRGIAKHRFEFWKMSVERIVPSAGCWQRAHIALSHHLFHGKFSRKPK